MPFTKLKLTTFGSTLETKWKQGKGVHFTRVALGDGLLGNGSMINRTSLVSERLSLQIDGIVASDDATQAAVIATLDNRDITEGFPYRELALMAKDPDTGREGTYLYDNAGQECEYLDTQANGVMIYERLKVLIRVEQAETIAFEASGNPLNITWTDIEPILVKKADLGENGKVVASQLPEMNYEPPLKDNAAKDTPADGDSLPIVDSADGGKTKRLLWSRVKALFAPMSHAARHASSGADPITAEAIGAAASTHQHSAGDISSGTLDATRIPGLPTSKLTSGTLPATRGGTGKASWTTNRLIYPSASTTLAQLAFPAVAGSVLRQGTSGAPYWTSLQDLVAALGDAGGVRIATGSYTGTGTYGADNPCSLTFPFVPRLIMLLGYEDTDGTWQPILGYNGGSYHVNEVFADMMTTEYKEGLGFCGYSGSYCKGKRSVDSKTFYWYSDRSAAYQRNFPGSIYHYMILG